MSGHEVGRP